MAKEKFEDVLKRLEEIVNTLENNEVSLDESISLYEEGLKLSKKLSKQLEVFEEKIDKLKEEDKDE